MAVRKLRKKQRGPWCSYCRERASWRGVTFTKFACQEHLSVLEKDDADAEKRDAHRSEADYQLGL